MSSFQSNSARVNPFFGNAAKQIVGIVGLGLLGGALAERLSECGFNVIGYDIEEDRCELARQFGAAVGEDSLSVFHRARRVILCLPTSDIVEQVLDEAKSTIQSKHTLIDTTTGDPTRMAQFERQVAANGAAYLDASVAGSSELARRGEIVMLVGGNGKTFAACADIFQALAKRAIHVGPPSSGAKLKLVHNLLLGLHRAVLAEGLCFAESLGLDSGEALSFLKDTVAYSKVMDFKGEKMVFREFKPQATLSQHLKDVKLMLAEAKRTRQSLPLTSLHCELLERAELAGIGALDNSAIIRMIERPEKE